LLSADILALLLQPASPIQCYETFASAQSALAISALGSPLSWPIKTTRLRIALELATPRAIVFVTFDRSDHPKTKKPYSSCAKIAGRLPLFAAKAQALTAVPSHLGDSNRYS
jgi:hypothetical protein